MLFLLETIIDTVLGAILFAIGLGADQASVGLGIALIAVGVMTMSPKKLVSLNSTYSSDQPLWNIALSLALGAAIAAAGVGIATVGGSGIKKMVGDTVGGALLRRKAFILPRKAYERAWTCGLGDLSGNGKSDAIALKRAMLSPDASVAVVAYATGEGSNEKTWLLTIDAATGEAIPPSSVYPTLDSYALLLGDGATMRRWLFDGSAPRSISSAKGGTWVHGTPEPRPRDQAAAFDDFEGTGLRVYAPFDGGSAYPVIVKEGEGLYSRSEDGSVLVFGSRGYKRLVEVSAQSDALAWWDASPGAETLAYSRKPLDSYKKFNSGKESDIYFAPLGGAAEPRSVAIPGRQADWLEFSGDGQAVYAFDTRLKVLTLLDTATGEETDRVVLYAKGLVDPAGISARGEAILVVDPKKPSVSLYRR